MELDILAGLSFRLSVIYLDGHIRDFYTLYIYICIYNSASKYVPIPLPDQRFCIHMTSLHDKKLLHNKLCPINSITAFLASICSTTSIQFQVKELPSVIHFDNIIHC